MYNSVQIIKFLFEERIAKEFDCKVFMDANPSWRANLVTGNEMLDNVVERMEEFEALLKKRGQNYTIASCRVSETDRTARIPPPKFTIQEVNLIFEHLRPTLRIRQDQLDHSPVDKTRSFFKTIFLRAYNKDWYSEMSKYFTDELKMFNHNTRYPRYYKVKALKVTKK